ncbi:MAG: hypothetical protein J6A79_09470 [Clostridia bacterium]|nr:hypothetical protein [Clostridia bacterium]
MTIYEVLSKLTAGEMAGWAAVLLILLLSLVQISPVKLNPWDNIFGWIGKKTNGETEKRLDKLEKHTREMWINNHRQTILTFARECRADIEHSSDEWTNVLNVAEEYEKYVTENKVTNGIITQDTEYIRNLYQEMSREHRI